MQASVRHQRILLLLRDCGAVSAAGLRRDLGVTAMTVWRDLKMLEELGLLRRTHGGARSLERAPGEPDFEAKNAAAHAAKQAIAALAARLFVREGDTIALEGGTTVAALIDHLPEKRVSILTNSLPVALRVREARPQLPVEVAGGAMSRISGNTTGPEALRAMERWKASLCFLSATGFDAESGPGDPNPFEIETKRILASRARRTVMLLDSSKFGVKSAAVTIHPSRLHALVSDARPPKEIRAFLRTYRVSFLIAPPPNHPPDIEGIS
jgi:DeoR/GlpR family transcriptional regulator of sugar metabolism